MKKSVKIRKIIFEILYEIHQKNVNFDESFINLTNKISLNDQEKSMIYNIVLNSIRNNFFIQNILKNLLQKKTSEKIKVLLVSAITQLLYLGFKGYAVTDDTVEVAKIKNLNPGLINSLLKNVISKEKEIEKNKIDPSSIPIWFKTILKKNKISFSQIIKNTSTEPSLHLVFKEKKYLASFKEDHSATTSTSAFVNNVKKIKNIEGYDKGHWWVQDLSSMLPIYLSPEIKYKKILDMCAAPGGKAFQGISQQNEVCLNDISSKRIKVLKDNLNRLNFNNKITNLDALNISEKERYDTIILDSPCSGVGTLRRNPEILFKKKQPEFEFLFKTQKQLINKAGKLLNNKGVLIYMVCSFLYEETKRIRDIFLNENKNFSQSKFNLNENNEFNKFIDTDGEIFTIPSNFKSFMIDGFYAVKFIKND